MSAQKQHKGNKRRSNETLDNSKDKKKHSNLSFCDAESRSSSCGSKKSHKKLRNSIKDQDEREDNFFIVDKIVGHKIHQGKSYFKVQWQGYDESEDSWEPEENLTNVLDLIDEYKNSKMCDAKFEDNNRSNNINRSRNAGCYEYVPSNKLIATKTKYFDDIRDGKIDLTKNDLYSRVKTRKRLHLDDNQDKPISIESTEAIIENSLIENLTENVETVTKPTEIPISYEKSKFYQTNLFEMTAEFMKNNESFKKSQNTIASKSSSNDDISLFNYSISPNTNQSDEFIVQISPAHHSSNINECNKHSVHTQTISLDIASENEDKIKTSEVAESEPIIYVKPHIQRIIDKVDKTLNGSFTPQQIVTNETHLLGIYAKEIRQGINSNINLPMIQTDSDLIIIDNLDDLKSSILLNKYQLLHNTLKDGAKFDWNEKFVPESLTPLQLAITKNRVNIVRLFLRYGAPPDFFDEDESETPLILASSLGYVHAVKALLDYGAFTDYRCKARTALYFAIENGRVSVVNMLLKFGTNFYRIAENLSGSALINDLFMTNSLPNVVYVDLLALMRNYHMSFITSLNHTINRYLTKNLIKQTCIIFPHQWVSVLENEFQIDFLLDSSIMTNIKTPILLLAHGTQADCDFEFWLDNNCCCVDSVFVNNERQSILGNSCFVTTLWPLNASTNKVIIHFTDKGLLSAEERQIRVAIVALSIEAPRTTNTKNRSNNTMYHQISHSRYYH